MLATAAKAALRVSVDAESFHLARKLATVIAEKRKRLEKAVTDSR